MDLFAKKIEILHSSDGINYDMLYEVQPDNSFNYNQKIFKYIVKPEGIKSRYIKLKASNIGQCPEYHPGSGGKAWIFTDEIIIL